MHHAAAPADSLGHVERAAQVLKALTAAHKESVHRPATEQAAHVKRALGARLAAAALGLKDTRTLQSWSRGGPIRGLSHEHRLQVLYQVTTAIEAVYSSAVAAAFLRGSNPQLGDRAPMLVIAQGEPVAIQAELMGAVEVLLQG